jgi:hypothetical protein
MHKQLAEMRLSEIDLLPRVGFWWSPDEPDLPHPRDFVDESWDESERRRVIEYLETSYLVPYVACGLSWCRMGCPGVPADIGSQDLTDGTWLYPEGFVHYLRHHRVKPPANFLEHLLRNRFEMPILPTVAPGSGNTPVVLLDVPVQKTYENELVIRFPARCLGWEPRIRVEPLWEEFEDQLVQAVYGPPKGRQLRFLWPALPYGAAEGSEITEFEMEVDSPLVAFTWIKPLLISRGLINDVIVAWRPKSAKVYQVIWPIGYCGQFHHYEDIL